MSNDLYAVLELPPDASVGEIDESYRRLGRLYRSGALPALQAKDRLVLIAHAYRVLSDPATRASYDASRVAVPSARGRATPERARDPERLPDHTGVTSAPRVPVPKGEEPWWRRGGPLEASLLALLITGFMLIPAWLAVSSWLSRSGPTVAVARSALSSPQAALPTALPTAAPSRTAAGSNVPDARVREAVLAAVLEYDLLEEQASRTLDATLLEARATDDWVAGKAAEYEQLRTRGIRSESSFVDIRFGGVRTVAPNQAEADTVEVWSNRKLDVQGRVVEESPPREIPQTVQLVLEQDRWKVVGVRFEAVNLARSAGRGDAPHSDPGIEATAVANLGAAGSLRQGGNSVGAADALATVVALGYSSVAGDAVRLRATVYAEATSTAVSAAAARSAQATQIASSAASTAAANATSAARRAAPPGFFTVGSTKRDVSAIQGTPTSLSDTQWHYGCSYVNFRNDAVTDWSNCNSGLKAILVPAPGTQAKSAFTVGDSKDVVIATQGSPTSFSNTQWHFGCSYVNFANNVVRDWSNCNGGLKARLIPAPGTQSPGYFTVGSTKDQVLATQGSPTSFSNTQWHFGCSYVNFLDGKVRDWSNCNSGLKVRL